MGCRHREFWFLHRGDTLKKPVISSFSGTVLHGKLIGYQGDELAIGGLFFWDGHAAAKGAVEGVDAAAAPCYLDGVADGALHLAGTGAKAPGNGGVQLFGDAVDGAAINVYNLLPAK